MQPKTTATVTTAATLLALAGASFLFPDLLSPSSAVSGETTIEEVVMYAVDADTNQLLRYGFDSTEYRVIGTVTDPGGALIDDLESFAHIRTGEHAGVYTSPQNGPYANHLLKVRLFNASCTPYASDIGHGNVVGMIASEDPATGIWTLYATTTTRKLITIDPATGLGTEIMPLAKSYDGLTMGPGGVLYAAVDDELWTIDPDAGTDALVGSHSFGKVEALEYAHGDDDPGVVIPGVPASWTVSGVLFGFSDEADTMVVFDPATGSAIDWMTPIATPDAEGIIFVTKRTDPVYHVLLAPYD